VFKKLKRYIQDPYYALGNDMIKKCPHLMSDKFYLSVLWKMLKGYELDWKHPKTFNEKLQWLKLYDRNPLYTTLVDKYRVKQWVADKIGERYIVPTLAVYNSVDEIDLDKLPDQFVLKCNHDSGSVVICRNKATFDLEAAKRKLGAALKKNFYWEAREWPYKHVKPCVFAENLLVDPKNSDELLDYKVFTLGGQPKIIQVDFDRFKCHRRNLYDTSWNYVEAQNHYPSQPDRVLDKPIVLDEMLDICRRLCENIKQVRVDFYVVEDRIYFGELTFFHAGGFIDFEPIEFAIQMGNWIKLPTDK
jgi:hypothetical protein